MCRANWLTRYAACAQGRYSVKDFQVHATCRGDVTNGRKLREARIPIFLSLIFLSRFIFPKQSREADRCR